MSKAKKPMDSEQIVKNVREAVNNAVSINKMKEAVDNARTMIANTITPSKAVAKFSSSVSNVPEEPIFKKFNHYDDDREKTTSPYSIEITHQHQNNPVPEHPSSMINNAVSNSVESKPQSVEPSNDPDFP